MFYNCHSTIAMHFSVLNSAGSRFLVLLSTSVLYKEQLILLPYLTESQKKLINFSKSFDSLVDCWRGMLLLFTFPR